MQSTMQRSIQAPMQKDKKKKIGINTVYAHLKNW